MLGLDDWIAGFSDGATLVVVVAVAIALGLRHATDPDHLAAVTALVAAGRDRTRRAGAHLGLAWGLGHAVTLFAFGLPILLYERFLPDFAQRGIEAAIGVMIAALAVWLLLRWRRGLLHPHATPVRLRTPLQAFGIGLVHGIGGSAGVGVLLLAAVESTAVAIVSLAVLALFTAVSMTVVTAGLGLTVSSAPLRRSYHAVAPALGAISLSFGVWYALAALELAPYYL
jgi:High-affinity nickel-transport protein